MEQIRRKTFKHKLHRKNWPLVVKITLAMTTMVILAVASVTLLSIRREQLTFRAELQQQATLLLDTLEAAITDFLYYQDSDALADIMEALGQNREILVSGRIYDTQGWIIADAYEEDLAYSIESDPFGEKLVKSDSMIFEWQSNQLIAGRSVTVAHQVLGAVSVGLPTSPLQVKIASMQKQGIKAALGTTIVSILLALLIYRSITSPLQELVKATYNIARGDLTQKIEIRSGDELAILGEAMEHMRSELQGLYHNLEQQVADRTRALQKSEARFRHVIASISDVIYMSEVTEEGTWINHYISPNIEALTGYSAERFMTDFQLWSSLIFPDDRQIAEERRAQYGKGQSNSGEYRIIQADGDVIWIRDNIRIEQKECQNNFTIYGVLSDITDHKHAEEELRRLEKAVETTEVGVTITDNDGRIVYTNPADAIMHGYTVDELIGQPSTIFAHLEAKDTSASPQKIKGFFHWKRERINVRKDGSIFPVVLISNPITDAQDQVIGKVVVCEDITERKQAEAQLLAAHNELREKNAQLAELNASKDKFFSIISHDLRSPFNVTLGFSQLLDAHFDRYSSDKIKMLIGKLRVSAEKFNSLLENLLTWSRIQRGAIEYAPVTIDIAEIVEENIDLFLAQAHQKQITLQGSVAPETYAYADENMVDTILRNLISNALKFTPSDGFIEVSGSQNNAVVEIAVSDTGTGISEEDISKLFRIDVQYTQTGTAGEKGTGLGLNLCKDLVGKNGGKIWIESEVGKGTTFRFTLPVLQFTNDSE